MDAAVIGGDETKKNRVLEFAENHPYILLAVISVLVILIIIMFLNSCGYNVPGMGEGKGKKKKKKEPLDDEEEMDELIASIHSKQRRKKCAQGDE